MRRFLRQAARTALLLLLVPLGGCLLTQSRTPLLPTGEPLPPGILSRDMPSGLGDTLTVRGEIGPNRARYLVSAAAGPVGSLAFLKFEDLPVSAIAVPDGEARALYLVQARVTGPGLRRLDRRIRLPADLRDDDAQRYLYLALALVRQGTDAPTLVPLDCPGEPLARLFRREAARTGLRFTEEGLVRTGDRDRVLATMRTALTRQLETGQCRAGPPLSLSPDKALELP